MIKTHISLTVLAAFLAGMIGAWVFSAKPTDHGDVVVAASIRESAYDRVMRTQTLRCGYVLWAPILMKDANTGKLSGIFYDYVEALGRTLKLKIDWAEEMGWSDFPTALEAGRIDSMCAGVWPNSARGRVIDFTRPAFYQPVLAYARAGDTRFDKNPDLLNDPSTTIVVVEGTTQSIIAAHDFPKANLHELPQLTSLGETLVNVVDKKADVAFVEPSQAAQYELNNPGKIHKVALKTPLRVFGVALAVGGGEDRLRRMLDTATGELVSSGQIEAVLQSYNPLSALFLRVAPPYQNETVSP